MKKAQRPIDVKDTLWSHIGKDAVDDLPKTFHGQCGHSTFAFASTGEVIG